MRSPLRPLARSIAFGIGLVVLGPVIGVAQSVRGRVVDPAGEPLDFAEVQLLPNGKPVMTNGSGRFDLGELSPGSHSIRVRRIGFELVTVRVAVPMATAELTITMNPAPVMLDTMHTRLLEAQLPRVFYRMNEHLGAVAFGPDLMKKYPGYSLDDVLHMDWKLWQQLWGAEHWGCKADAYIDGRLVPEPLGVDWARALSPSHNPVSGTTLDLGLRQQIQMRDVAAVEVFNSPDFVHEPAIDGHYRANMCRRIVLVWTNGHQQLPWAGH